MLFMITVEKFDPVSVADYLKGEQTAKRKHEYIGGNVYAMAGASNVHNRIATNVTVAFGSQFRDSPCEIFNSDTKVRVRAQNGMRFFYPDAMVVCKPNGRSLSGRTRCHCSSSVAFDSTGRYGRKA